MLLFICSRSNNNNNRILFVHVILWWLRYSLATAFISPVYIGWGKWDSPDSSNDLPGQRRTAPTTVPWLLPRRSSGSTTTRFSWTYSPFSEGGWYPRNMDTITEKATLIIEQEAVRLAAELVRNRFHERRASVSCLDENHFAVPEKYDDNSVFSNVSEHSSSSLFSLNDRSRSFGRIPNIVRGRFMDLTCDRDGERVLEHLFQDVRHDVSEKILLATVMVVQSLCILGTQVGVRGPPEQLKRMVAHLNDTTTLGRNDPALYKRDMSVWDCDSVRRLKLNLDRTPALQLLTELNLKRAPQGAFNLLVAIGAWKKHEDLALLRSGFPLRFTDTELMAAREVALAAQSTAHYDQDPDQILGIRRNLTAMKVYTIDSASTSEVDDGISLEAIQKDDGTVKHRIWVHIADVSRWASHSESPLFEIARRRVTSLYLPNRCIPMFPPSVSIELMSLKVNSERYALSLAVELLKDGSVDPASIFVTSSLIRPSYRLTYDEVDEMLEEGIGYREEWQLGALLDAAMARREYRVEHGSTEGIIPNPIPYCTVSVYHDRWAPDGVGISHNIQVSHNAGKNRTAFAQDSTVANISVPSPVSSAYLLVTEMMILAGEAIGHFKDRVDKELKPVNGNVISNQLRLAFRSQLKPDTKSRARERRMLMNLLEYNIGSGLCHAWYYRRFMQPVRVTETPLPHAGLGLLFYVQWTSPIRRFSDLAVHISVKRFLRRERVQQILDERLSLPKGLQCKDLGFPTGTKLTDFVRVDRLDKDISFLDGIGLNQAARTLQRRSTEYWLYEYIQRLLTKDPNLRYTAIVLGSLDPEKNQYAIFIEQLALENRFTATGRLELGSRLLLMVDKVSARLGLLSFVQAV